MKKATNIPNRTSRFTYVNPAAVIPKKVTVVMSEKQGQLPTALPRSRVTAATDAASDAIAIKKKNTTCCCYPQQGQKRTSFCAATEKSHPSCGTESRALHSQKTEAFRKPSEDQFSRTFINFKNPYRFISVKKCNELKRCASCVQRWDWTAMTNWAYGRSQSERNVCAPRKRLDAGGAHISRYKLTRFNNVAHCLGNVDSSPFPTISSSVLAPPMSSQPQKSPVETTSFKIRTKYKLRRHSSQGFSGPPLKKLGRYKLIRRLSKKHAILPEKAVLPVTPGKSNPYRLILNKSRMPLLPDAASVVSRFKLVRNRRCHSFPRTFSSSRRFSVSKDGRTLKRTDTSVLSSNAETSGDKVQLLGATFQKEGNLYTLDRRTQYKKKRVSMALNRSRKLVSGKKLTLERRYCLFFNRYGRCSKGENCRFVHDQSKVAVCSRFLRGTCKEKECSFSHTLNKDKMPLCDFFLRGVCIREKCPYVHVKHSEDTKVCPAFLTGHCPKGQKCDKKHVFVWRKKARKTGNSADGGQGRTSAVKIVADKLKKKRNRYADLPKICDGTAQKIIPKKPRDFMDALPEYIGFESDSEDQPLSE